MVPEGCAGGRVWGPGWPGTVTLDHRPRAAVRSLLRGARLCPEAEGQRGGGGGTAQPPAQRSAGLVSLPQPRSDLCFPPRDSEDPLAGLLSDDEEGTTKQLPGTESKAVSEKSPAPTRDQGRRGLLVPGRSRRRSVQSRDLPGGAAGRRPGSRDLSSLRRDGGAGAQRGKPGSGAGWGSRSCADQALDACCPSQRSGLQGNVSLRPSEHQR